MVATTEQAPAAAPPARRSRGELAAYAVLVLAALALRLIDLGDRPFHHDESQDAYFSWIFFTEGDYEYNPLLHGPLRFYLTAGVYALFGDSDFTARLAPALMGTLMVPLPYLLRAQLGRVGAFTAAALLAFGPSYLYFSRFAREDIYFAAISLALLVVVFRFLDRPRRYHPALIGALLAAAFATKETTFITGFVGFTYVLIVLVWRREALLRPIRVVGLESWGWGLAAFLGVYTLLFTTFLTNPEGVKGLYTGLDYWLGQHDVGRGGEPWYFYLVLLFGEEWPVLLLGLVGGVIALRRGSLLGVFLVWAFVVSLVVYSWAGEKFAWLVLHPLLPLILLAGIGVQAIWSSRRHWYGRLGLVAVAAGFAYVGYASFTVNALNRADPRELLVSTQTSEEVARVADEVVAADERSERPLSVTVDASEGATFPWAWYFRDLDGVGYLEMGANATAPAPDSDVLILTQGAHDRLAGELAGRSGRQIPFRVWWVRDYGAMSPGGWWRWFTKREPWSPTGGMPEWVYRR